MPHASARATPPHRDLMPPAELPPRGQRPPKLLASRRRKLLLGVLVLNGFTQAGAAAVTALLAQRAFDRLVEAGSAASIGMVTVSAIGLAGAAVLLGVLRARERSDAERLGQDFVHALRRRMYARLSELGPRALQGRSQGAVSLRFVGDLTAINRWVSLGLSRLIVGGTFIVGTLVALAFISLALAVAVGFVVALGIATAMASSGALRRRAREARRRRARLAGNVSEKVGAIGVVQAFGQTGREKRRVRKQSAALGAAMVARASVVGRMRGITETTGLLASVAILLVGAHEVGRDAASVGTVVAALSIVGLMVAPLRDLGRVNELWHSSRIAMEKAESFLLTPNVVHERSDAPSLAPGPGRLELEEVRLDGGLDGVTGTAEAGSLVVLTGPNGAGKSSLIAVAARLMDPDAGVVRLDGQDIGEHDLASLRRAVSIVGSDFPPLRGTVARNLRYRWPDAPEEELTRVRVLTGLDAMLAELPDGEETRVVEGGGNLSAGQRQRISLARALLGDPRLLLLDEADANLDADARALIDRIVREQRGQRTIVVVSHRPAVQELADAVWLMEEGRLVSITDVAPRDDAAAAFASSARVEAS